MKYVFFTLNIFFDLLAHLLLFLVWRYFFHIGNLYMQVAVAMLLVLSICLTAIAPLLVHWRDNVFNRSLYLIVSLWMGMMLNVALVAGVLTIFSWAGSFYGIALGGVAEAYIIGFLPLLMLLPEAWLAQAHRIKKGTVKIKGLPEVWNGKEIIHISDVHLGPIWRQRFFDSLVQKVNGIGAEAIFITGDLFDGMDTDFSWFHGRHFEAPLGVFYAFGNHDLSLGASRVKSLLSASNIEILDNDIKKVSGLQIIGLTCYFEGRLDVKGAILSRLGYDPEQPSILMYHEPRDISAARAAGIDLQLSGHTHGGQMFPINLIAHAVYKGLGYGLYHWSDFVLSVTSGAGTWGPPLRLGGRSEIVVLKLVAA